MAYDPGSNSSDVDHSVSGASSGFGFAAASAAPHETRGYINSVCENSAVLPELLRTPSLGRGHTQGHARVKVQRPISSSISSSESHVISRNSSSDSTSSTSSSGSYMISRNSSSDSTRSRNEKRPREGDEPEREGTIAKTISSEISSVSLAAPAAEAAAPAAHVDQSYFRYEAFSASSASSASSEQQKFSAYALIRNCGQIVLAKNFKYISDMKNVDAVILGGSGSINLRGTIPIVVDTNVHPLTDPELTGFLVQKTVEAVSRYGFVNIKYYSSGFKKDEAEKVLNLENAQVCAILEGIEAYFNRIGIEIKTPEKGVILRKPARPIPVSDRQIHLQLLSHSGNEIKLKLSYKDDSALLTLPGGGNTPSEDPLRCVIREVKEELALDLPSIASTSEEWWPVRHNPGMYFYLVDVEDEIEKRIRECNSTTTLFGEVYDVKFIDEMSLDRLKLNAKAREGAAMLRSLRSAVPHGHQPGFPRQFAHSAASAQNTSATSSSMHRGPHK
jgi:hypothetical protein